MKASFVTGHNQREIVMDVKVEADMTVGTVVSLDTAGDTITAVANSTAPATSHYIVAQSDMTMGYKRDYSKSEFEYSDKVAASTSTKKKVALFRVVDVADVIYKN